MQFTPRQRVWIRRIARESASGSGTFIGVGAVLALMYQTLDVWLLGMIGLGVCMCALGFLLIPLYVEDLEDDD